MSMPAPDKPIPPGAVRVLFYSLVHPHSPLIRHLPAKLMKLFVRIDTGETEACLYGMAPLNHSPVEWGDAAGPVPGLAPR